MNIEIDVSDGTSGQWKVETFTVSESDAKWANVKASISTSSRGRFIHPGNYKRLMRGGTVVMSNTMAEINDHLSFIYTAKRCKSSLINGLGLGMALKAVLESDLVEDVTVVEISEDVISLVGDTYLVDPRVNIVHASAFDYKPPKGKRYGAVWHDIWDNICSDNLPEMHKLHRKYGKRCDWQGSWGCQQLR